jgi:hypothetical protein
MHLFVAAAEEAKSAINEANHVSPSSANNAAATPMNLDDPPLPLCESGQCYDELGDRGSHEGMC